MIVVIDARESLALSASRDVLSFGMLIGTALLLNTMMPPSSWINAAIAIAWILWMIGRGARRCHEMTLPQVREWLDEEASASPAES